MSIVRLRKIFRKKASIGTAKRRIQLPSVATIIFGVIVVIFVVGAYYTFGGPARRAGREQALSAKLTKLVAVVNGHKIGRVPFEENFYRALDRQRGTVRVTDIRRLREELLESMIMGILIPEAAEAEGIKVSRADLAAKREELLDETINQKYPTKKALRDHLDRRGISYEQLVAQERQRLPGDDALREEIIWDKLRELVESRVQVTDQQVRDSFAELKVQHILIRPERIQEEHEAQWAEEHQSTEQPATEVPPAPEIDPDALARQKIDKLLAQVKAGADFATLAKENSHDPGSASKGGELDVRVGRMVPEFEEAAFALKPGEVSNVVKTDYGYHIIKLLSRKDDLPDDFDSNKEMYENQVLERLKRQAWMEYLDNLHEAATIEIHDPELLAYKLLGEGQQEAAEVKLREAADADPDNVSARYQLAQLYDQRGESEETIRLLEEVISNTMGAGDPSVHFRLAQLYEEKGQADDAQASYVQAGERASALDWGNYGIHMQLKGIFERLDLPDMVAREEQWMADFNEHMETTGGGGLPGGTFTIPGG